jgi:hypothetical protein
MALRLVRVNVKAVDDTALGRFWAQALGWTATSPGHDATSVTPPGYDGTDRAAPVGIDVIRVPDPRTARGRVHLDLATTSLTHQAGLVARLIELGATRADIGQGDVPWTVLADPAGNVFCVLEPREIYRDTGPIAAVVVDGADPQAIGHFWAGALGWTTIAATAEYAQLRSPQSTGPYLEFLRTSGTPRWWNHAHLDLAPLPGDDQETEVARVVTLGAAPADAGQGDVSGTFLTDPAGNLFRVLKPVGGHDTGQ